MLGRVGGGGVGREARGITFSVLFFRALHGMQQQKGIQQRGRETLSDPEVEEGEEKEAQHRRVGLETLAGRLSRRGGSTPPEGDFELRVYGGGGGYRRRERWGNARRAGREIAKALYGE